MTLFAVLLACIVSVNAVSSSPAPIKATVQHKGDSYEPKAEGPGPADSGDSDEYYSEDKKEADVCPDPQPADSIKDGETAQPAAAAPNQNLSLCKQHISASSLLLQG